MSKQKAPKTIDEQMDFVFDYSAYFVERIWETLDKFNVSYNAKTKQAMMDEFFQMHNAFFSMVMGHSCSILSVRPHPEILKDQHNRIMKEWFKKQPKCPVGSSDDKFLSESRCDKFRQLVEAKFEN